MKLEFTKFVTAVSRATDFVEAEILNIPHYHEKRVAVISGVMGRAMGMDDETVYALTLAGALHDCALSEYLADEYPEGGYVNEEINFADHCISGERMLQHFPFYEKVKGAVLHHHDRADGGGAMGVTADETPIYGQILHIADLADAVFGLDTMDPAKYCSIIEWLDENRGTAFTDEMADVFRDAASYELLQSITGDGSVAVLDAMVPAVEVDVPMDVMREISTFFAHITDYKSHFTWRHSLGIAEKAELMGRFYGYDRELQDELFIAGALHDIGKLLIPNDILEKPGRLTSEEYRTIQNHAMGTWELLHDIGGMEDICRWASLHHEKLDGSGYPFGLTADNLGKHERLMACLDIYQALVEERPYKKGLSHAEAMAILQKMAAEGQLDAEITGDIDRCFGLREEENEPADAVMMSGAVADAAVMSDARAGAAIKSGVPADEINTDARAYAADANEDSDAAVNGTVCENLHEAAKAISEVWRCPVCGYTYEGELPEDFICPQCEQPGSIFEKIQ